MNDILKPVGEWIASHIPISIGIGIFIFCLFFEISKIKVYPLKWLWKAISWPFRKIDEQRTASFKNLVVTLKKDIDAKMTDMANSSNKNCAAVKSCFTDLEKRFDKLDEKQVETEERLDLLAAARIKNHVLNFARQCRRGEKHSREDYLNLFREHREYLTLVERHKWQNDVYLHDFAYIEHTYDECNLKNDFLGG